MAPKHGPYGTTNLHLNILSLIIERHQVKILILVNEEVID